MKIDFYYDLRSPYAYFAWSRRNILSNAGFIMCMRPVSISILLNLQAGREPWADYVDPLCAAKRAHLMADIPRMASYWNIPLNWPPSFKPQSTRAMSLAIALYSAGKDQEKLVDAAFKLLWVEQRDLEASDTFSKLLEIADMQAFDEERVRNDLTENSVQAFDAGVFGVPTFKLNGQAYFGADRMEVIAKEIDG